MAASDSGMRLLLAGASVDIFGSRSGAAKRRLRSRQSLKPPASRPVALGLAPGESDRTGALPWRLPRDDRSRHPRRAASCDRGRRPGLDGGEHVGRRRAQEPAPVPARPRVAGRARRDRGDGARCCRGALGRSLDGEGAERSRRAPPCSASVTVGFARRASRARAPCKAEHGADRVHGIPRASCSPSGAAVARRFSFAGSSVRDVGKPYVAWIVAPGAAPTRAAQFVGVERAVFLSRALGPRASVVVSTTRPARTARAEPRRRVRR